MHGHSNAAASRRSRLGGWLPEKEEHLAQYRLDIAGAARRSNAGALRNRSVQRLAALVRADPVLRMDLSRAIDEARQAGYTLGYGNIDELMIMLDYMLGYAPPTARPV